MKAPTWRLFVGPVVWACHFFAIYASTAIVCARAGSGATIALAVAGATLVAAAILLWTVAATVRDRAATASARRAFIRRLTMTTAGLALVAVVFETLPLLLVPACR